MHPRWVFVGMGSLASLGAVAAGLAWRKELGPLSLAEELAAARREGIVVDPDRMPVPKLSPAEDGTQAFLKASALSKRVVKGTQWNLEFHPLAGPIGRPIPVASHPPAVRAKLRQIIAKQDEGIAALREAGLRGRFSIDPQWGRPFMSERDDPITIRDLTKTLVVRAELRRVEGDLAGAREDVMTLARTAALYRDRQTLVEGSMRIGIERQALRAAQDYAAARPLDPTSPALLRRVVATFGAPHDLRRLLEGEVIKSLAFIEARSQFESGWDRDSLIRLSPVREANLAYQVSYWRTLFRALPKDPLDFDGAGRALAATARAYDGKSLRAMAIETHRGQSEYLAQAEARRRVALAAADVLERWQRTGTVPAGLTNPPPDPFGGSIHFLRKGKGFIVYSYDLDRVDHGGVEGLEPIRPGDITARIAL